MKSLFSICLLVAATLLVTSSAIAQDMATKDECVNKCKQAAQLASDKGIDEAIKQVNDKNGPFVWKDTYVFIIHIDTHQLAAHPIKPALIGRDLSGMKDISGKMFFIEMTNIGKDKGEGWVSYMWPKTGEKKPSPKISYVYKVKDQPYIMCAGIYE